MAQRIKIGTAVLDFPDDAVESEILGFAEENGAQFGLKEAPGPGVFTRIGDFLAEHTAPSAQITPYYMQGIPPGAMKAVPLADRPSPPEPERPVMRAPSAPVAEITAEQQLAAMQEAERRVERGMRIGQREEILADPTAGFGEQVIAALEPYTQMAAERSALGTLGRAVFGGEPVDWGPEMEPTSVPGRLGMTGLTLAHDAPLFMLGGAGGRSLGAALGTGKVILGGAGTFGLPAAIRGGAESTLAGGDVGDIALGATTEGAKGAMLGGLMGATGFVPGGPLVGIPAKTAVLGTGGPVLEGRAPTMQDYVDALTLVGAFEATGAAVKYAGRPIQQKGKTLADIEAEFWRSVREVPQPESGKSVSATKDAAVRQGFSKFAGELARKHAYAQGAEPAEAEAAYQDARKTAFRDPWGMRRQLAKWDEGAIIGDAIERQLEGIQRGAPVTTIGQVLGGEPAPPQIPLPPTRVRPSPPQAIKPAAVEAKTALEPAITAPVRVEPTPTPKTPVLPPTVPQERPAVPEGKPPTVPEIVQPAPAEVAQPAAKEPWEMTKAEYFESINIRGKKSRINSDLEHSLAVEESLSRGLPVPPEVLAEYPHLQPQPMEVISHALPREEVGQEAQKVEPTPPTAPRKEPTTEAAAVTPLQPPPLPETAPEQVVSEPEPEAEVPVQQQLPGAAKAAVEPEAGGITRAAQLGQPPRAIPRPSHPVQHTPPETDQGRVLLRKIQTDTKHRVGLRSVGETLARSLHARLLVTKSQTSKARPAQFKSWGAVIPTRSGVWSANIHEAGHALTELLNDKNPKWLAPLKSDLDAFLETDLADQASAKNVHEAVAEWVRQYVTNPQILPPALSSKMEAAISAADPDALAAIRDTQRAYAAHQARPVEEQLDTIVNDKPPRPPALDYAAAAVKRVLYDLFGGDHVVHALERKMFEGLAPARFSRVDPVGLRELYSKAYRSQLKFARDFMADLKGTTADFNEIYSSRKRIPVETAEALHGHGVRVHLWKGQITKEVIDELKQAGYTLDLKEGEYVKLSEPLSAIRARVGDENWKSFVTYGQFRVALHRYKTKGHEYPGLRDGLDPETLQSWVNDQKRKHPEWEAEFKAVNDYMDSLLAFSVLSGEKTGAEIAQIRGAWEEYWPLPRVKEQGPQTPARRGADLSSGLMRAYGSPAALQSFEDAVKNRVRGAIQSYYESMIRSSVVNAIQKAAKVLPYEYRVDLERQLVPLHLDIKKMATLSPEEQIKLIADYLNKQAEQQGEEPIAVEDIDYQPPGQPIFRPTPPNMVRVISTFSKGERQYWHVTDPVFFDFFAQSRQPARMLVWWDRIGSAITAPWKRLLTQNIPFAVANLPRDTTTALFKGESFVPGIYAGISVVDQICGRKPDMARIELFSRSFEATTAPEHHGLVQFFKDMIAQGLTTTEPIGSPEWLAEIPGRISGLASKPGEIFNWLTLGPVASRWSEETHRAGAYGAAKRRGATEVGAQQASERISGEFTETPGSPNVTAFLRPAGFVLPGMRILYGIGEDFASYDPKVRRTATMKLGYIAALGAVAGAMEVLLNVLLGKDDEDKDQRLNALRERPDKDRLSYMTVGGSWKLPFDYGILGAAASYGWNSTQEYLLDDPIQSVSKARTLLARARDIPGITDVIPPHLKTWMELVQNHSFFFDEDIVPRWMEDMPPGEQAWPETPELYKQVGKSLGVSPIKTEYALRALFTRQLTDTVRLLDRAAQGQVPVRHGADIPLLSRFAQREPVGFGSQSVMDVETADKLYSALNRKYKEAVRNGDDYGELFTQMEKLTATRIAWKQIRNYQKQVTEEYARKPADVSEIKRLQRAMTETAQEALRETGP